MSLPENINWGLVIMAVCFAICIIQLNSKVENVERELRDLRDALNNSNITF
ncbi:MAG: hypothetical protein H8D23_31685 [Candidatus Brocadiales bacterium]|nr:hypothetical protein [Candidatus Brocadiales bacterium]